MGGAGMFEAIPIVGALARATGSSDAIAVFKIFLMGCGAAIFYELRRLSTARCSALLSLIIYLCVLIAWVRYLTTDVISQPISVAPATTEWIQLNC
jgi:hypothetical protein